MNSQLSTSDSVPGNQQSELTERDSKELIPADKSLWSRCREALSWSASFILILMVKLYQVTLGPFLGGRCRFYPSCSNYFIQAVRKHGPIKGAWKGLYRLCRCHPFCEGGYDPP
ncbi:membrane protein insertion efficiency factor YidD [Thalassoglobus sp. JC818]|uniref:membrane protein insertion efficiency factor YidD n=1 Tax=Thalassoglobus sp. JC818 TaxID=3232136 RepID=UPI00345A1F97